MFESLDEDSPARMPPADPGVGARRVSRVVSLLLSTTGFLSRRGVGPFSMRGWTGAALIGAGVIVFVVFEYRAYRDARDGPIDLKL
jgi:hypothetical protein